VTLEALNEVRAEIPEMIVGAGTILTPDQVQSGKEAGAYFGVAPGMNSKVLAAAREAGFLFAPGVTTPSDIKAALEFDCRLLKFFPAESSGGLPYLNAIARLPSFRYQVYTSWWPQPEQYGFLSSGFENCRPRRFVAGSAPPDQGRCMERNYRTGYVCHGDNSIGSR
jgi:hypothetical protein